jgi:hypothetical protein
VLRTIVEGEPGIFPEPVARVMRTIGGWFDRRKPAEEPPAADGDGQADAVAPDAVAPDAVAPDAAAPPASGDDARAPGGDDHSGESR